AGDLVALGPPRGLVVEAPDRGGEAAQKVTLAHPAATGDEDQLGPRPGPGRAEGGPLPGSVDDVTRLVGSAHLPSTGEDVPRVEVPQVEVTRRTRDAHRHEHLGDTHACAERIDHSCQAVDRTVRRGSGL